MLPADTKAVLKRWRETHAEAGVEPSSAEKRRLSIESGLDLHLLNKYFVKRGAASTRASAGNVANAGETRMTSPTEEAKRARETLNPNEIRGCRRRKRRRTSEESNDAGRSPTNIMGKSHERASPSTPSLPTPTPTPTTESPSAHRPVSTGVVAGAGAAAGSTTTPTPKSAALTSTQPAPAPAGASSAAPSGSCTPRTNPQRSIDDENSMSSLTTRVVSHVSYALLLRTIREIGTCVSVSLNDSVECSLRAEAARSVTIAKHSCSVGLGAACARYGALDVLFAALHTALSTLRGACVPALSPALGTALALARHNPHAPPVAPPTPAGIAREQAEETPAPTPQRDADLDAWFARSRSRRSSAGTGASRGHFPARGTAAGTGAHTDGTSAVFGIPVGAACTDDRYMAERTFTGLVHRVLAHDGLALLLHAMCGGVGGMQVPVLQLARARNNSVCELYSRAGIACARSRYGYLDVLFGGLLLAFPRSLSSSLSLSEALRAVMLASGMPRPRARPEPRERPKPKQRKRVRMGVSELASAALRDFARTRSRTTERWWAVLEAWFDDNVEDPYPDADTLWLLTQQSGLTSNQVETYLRSKRLEQHPSRSRARARKGALTGVSNAALPPVQASNSMNSSQTPNSTPVSAVQAIAALSARARALANTGARGEKTKAR